jgi:head-tail adaptor
MPRALTPAADTGQRDRFVTIEQLTESVADSQYPVETWATLSTAWMYKRDASMTERFKAAQVSAAFDTQWEMDYRGEMDPDRVDVPKTRRLRYLDRVYDITGARVIGRREGIELLTLAASGV